VPKVRDCDVYVKTYDERFILLKEGLVYLLDLCGHFPKLIKYFQFDTRIEMILNCAVSLNVYNTTALKNMLSV